MIYFTGFMNVLVMLLDSIWLVVSKIFSFILKHVKMGAGSCAFLEGTKVEIGKKMYR